MYTPAPFTEHRREVLFDFLDQHSFATLVTAAGGTGILASHIPLMLDRDRGESGALVGHLARANPQSGFVDGSSVLAIFHGPHAYVSPTWYETKNAVPTWNYVAVHAHGKFQLLEDPNEKWDVIQRMVEYYEAGNDPAWSLDTPDREYVERMLRAVVVFRIEIERLEGTWKLSQNHEEARRERVICGLQQIGGESRQQIAELMQRTRTSS
jgi:transcriptional regulator